VKASLIQLQQSALKLLPCCVLTLDLVQDVQPCEIEGEYKP